MLWTKKGGVFLVWQKKKSQSSLLRLWDRYKTQNTLMTIILMLGCTYTLVASLKGLLWNTSASYSNSRNIAFGCVIGFLIYAAVNFLRVYQLSLLRKDFVRIILSSRDIKPEEVRDEESFFTTKWYTTVRNTKKSNDLRLSQTSSFRLY
jgi:hypothetical protein